MIINERSYALDEELYFKFGERPKLTKTTKPKQGVVYELSGHHRAYIRDLFGVTPSKEVECLEVPGEATWEVEPEWAITPDGEKVCIGWGAKQLEPATTKARWRSVGHSTPTGKKLILSSFSLNPSELPDEPLTNKSADEGRPNRKVKTKTTKITLDLSIFD